MGNKKSISLIKIFHFQFIFKRKKIGFLKESAVLAFTNFQIIIKRQKKILIFISMLKKDVTTIILITEVYCCMIIIIQQNNLANNNNSVILCKTKSSPYPL